MRQSARVFWYKVFVKLKIVCTEFVSHFNSFWQMLTKLFCNIQKKESRWCQTLINLSVPIPIFSLQEHFFLQEHFCNVIITNLHILVTDRKVTLVHTQKVRFPEFSGGLLHVRQVVPNYLKRSFFQILGMSSICKPDRCLNPIMRFSYFKNEDWGLAKSYLCCLCLPEI